MTIKVDGLAELQQAFAEGAPRRMRALSQQTLNRGAATGRTRLVRIVTGELNLQAGYVREQISIRPATPDRLEAALIARKRPILLSRFDARPVTKSVSRRVARDGRMVPERKRVSAGISVRIKRGGPREVLPGTFLFRSPKNGALIAAVRVPVGGRAKSGRQKRVARFPVEALYGPSVDQLYRRHRPQLGRELLQFVSQELDRRIAKETLGKVARGLVR